MKQKSNNFVQDWLPFKKIINKGIIILKDNSIIKIIKITPINFNLKSELEKEAILNSYKIFLKTCNFDIQILIQSNKEDLTKNISNIRNKIENEKSKKIKNISEKYIEFIKKTNKLKKSSSKNFFIILKNSNLNNKVNNKNYEEIAIEELNDKYFKIKECLSRCGNNAIEIETKEELLKIMFSFLNNRLNENNS